jgi:hypothetical protein
MSFGGGWDVRVVGEVGRRIRIVVVDWKIILHQR